MTATQVEAPDKGEAADVRAARRRGTLSVVAQRFALLALTLAAWELLAVWLDSRAVPHVAPVAEALFTTVPTAAFWAAVWGTVKSWALGVLLAAVIGIPAGVAIGSSAAVMRLTRGSLEFLRTVPAIMLVPLAVLLYGSTIQMKVFLITLSAVWPLVLHASYGIGHIDPVARDSVQVFRLGSRERIIFLYLPGALPVIATGLRVAATVALLVSVGAEIVTSAPGVGYEILLSQANNNSPRAFVFVLVSGLLGVVINLTFSALERRTMFWHASQRSRATR